MMTLNEALAVQQVVNQRYIATSVAMGALTPQEHEQVLASLALVTQSATAYAAVDEAERAAADAPAEQAKDDSDEARIPIEGGS
jgi:predicted benzoate:H+ symporter BenE